MCKLFRRVLFISLVSYIPLASATDIHTLDISGVKLGMTLEQSISAVKEYMKISDDDISIGFSKQNPISGKMEPSYISIKINLRELLVHFTPNALDPNNSTSVVSQISFKIPWTPENVESMKNSALNKYSTPSHKMGDMYTWCKNPNPVQGCVGEDALSLYGTSLKMHDLKYNQALSKFRQSKNNVSPGF